MNRLLLSALLWLGLASAALAQSIGVAPAIGGSGGIGNVVGPASSTDNAIVRWDGTTGALIQNSAPTIDDTTGSIKFNTATGTLSFGAASDVILARDAANTLAQRNGVNAQTFNLYNTYTDASNYETGGLNWTTTANTLTLTTAAAGTGTGRNLDIGFVGNKLRFTSGGGILFTGFVDFATNGRIKFGNQGGLQSGGSDGLIELINNSANDFGRLQFGGTTSSFPSLARNGIKIDVKLADNSTYAPIGVSAVIAAGAVPTLALAGGTCAGTVIAGGATAGTVTLTGVCAATNTLTLTVMPTVPVGYACDADDRTTKTVIIAQSATTTTGTTFTFSGTTGATDVIVYKCMGY